MFMIENGGKTPAKQRLSKWSCEVGGGLAKVPGGLSPSIETSAETYSF